jgi:hypothetical protein
MDKIIIGFSVFFVWHILIRIVPSGIFFLLKPKIRMNANNWFFREKKFERHLYRILGVKKWKQYFPTFCPKGILAISPKLVPDKKVLVCNLCMRELGHFIFSVISLPALSVIFYIGFNLYVFLILLLLHILIVFYVDIIAIIIQRYNRSRVLKLLAIQKTTEL